MQQIKATTFCLIFFTNILTGLALNKDGLLLLKVKQNFGNTTASFSNWSDRDLTPCNWTGVKCNAQGSVHSVVLPNASLSGPFPILLCHLPSILKINLFNNSINSTIPNDISRCQNLTYLDLSQNYLEGQLPSTLADLRLLRYLILDGNSISGEIPESFGDFRKLETLSISSNMLNGNIPANLGNISSLKSLRLAYNMFSPGDLAPELGNLSRLEILWLTNCSLTGTIPESFGKLVQLKNFDVANNRLTGPIPGVILQLKSVEQIEIFGNAFSGNLPAGWSNLTGLRRFDASSNHLTGTIPDELCQLPLESLNLYLNQLEGSIPESIAKSPNLLELKLFANRLTGSLPSELGKNSALQVIDVSSCNLTGEIPKFLCQNGALEGLILIKNAFSGHVPVNLGKCQTLRRVRLSGNKFDGEIPAEFWGLPEVYLLDLYDNEFSGNISNFIYGAKNLSTLNLSRNKFSGTIPSEIGTLETLVVFLADHNELSGEIPSSIVHLSQLERLDLSSNEITGAIPKNVQSLMQLNELNLASNRLSGDIPEEIGKLPVLNYLDLSENNFSGRIPVMLQNLHLNKLNLSFNHLSGDIPLVFAGGIYSDSFLGNPGLCTHISGSCSNSVNDKNRTVSWVLKLMIVVAGFLVLVSLAWFMQKYKKIDEIKKSDIITKWTSFHKLGFSETEIGDCLKDADVIGTGASGDVYKVILSNGETVAVKKLLERSFKEDVNDFHVDRDEFDVEVETLGKIRHKNIVRLWCCCTRGNYKLLVYEYMPNGSLGDLLHGSNGKFLDWPKRFRIVLDAAEGLSYLHHDSVPPIVHRDIKSNNILLDEYFGAKIADFGVAKAVKSLDRGVESMSVVAGSCGYIAPEYAYTLRVTEKSDVYSFGIVILELVTGKPPSDPELGVKDLPTWVSINMAQKGTNHVIDPKLEERFHEHIFRVLDIGLLCSSSLPLNRPSMRRVIKMLQDLGAVDVEMV